MAQLNSRIALARAVQAAQQAGRLMRRNLRLDKVVNETTQHDLKIALDIRCQKLIERILCAGFPQAYFLGEEGTSGDPTAPHRWVVDPIDGTVNFTYGIPHAGVSIALQSRRGATDEWRTVIGVVLDPFCEELWTAIRGQRALLNGKPIYVSRRAELRETIISLGFGKHRPAMRRMMAGFNWLIPRARKVRITGSAALGLCYVATGRFDAYVEAGLRLWDIAAGGLIIECAGGEFWHRRQSGSDSYDVLASNGKLRRPLRGVMDSGQR